MNIKLIKELMRGQPLQVLDAARLVMVAGIAAIQTEERTECFEKVAWESAHSYRKGRVILHSIFA